MQISLIVIIAILIIGIVLCFRENEALCNEINAVNLKLSKVESRLYDMNGVVQGLFNEYRARELAALNKSIPVPQWKSGITTVHCGVDAATNTVLL